MPLPHRHDRYLPHPPLVLLLTLALAAALLPATAPTANTPLSDLEAELLTHLDLDLDTNTDPSSTVRAILREQHHPNAYADLPHPPPPALLHALATAYFGSHQPDLAVLTSDLLAALAPSAPQPARSIMLLTAGHVLDALASHPTARATPQALVERLAFVQIKLARHLLHRNRTEHERRVLQQACNTPPPPADHGHVSLPAVAAFATACILHQGGLAALEPDPDPPGPAFFQTLAAFPDGGRLLAHALELYSPSSTHLPPLSAPPAHAKPVVLPFASFSPDTHLPPAVPILFTGLPPLPHSVSLETLLADFAALPVHVSAIPYADTFGLPSQPSTLGAFAADARAAKLSSSTSSSVFAALNADHSSAASSLIRRLQSAGLPAPLRSLDVQNVQFYFGPPGSGTPSHSHHAAYNMLLHGRKCWRLLPPHSAIYATAREPLVSQSHCTLIQEANQLLVLPARWSHAIDNLDEVIGWASEFE